MSPADDVFSHCRFFWLSQTNVPVVLLDPGINRISMKQSKFYMIKLNPGGLA
jgi:hypothetical protein